eukprot:1097952-Amorphochlora_amoeboformis.AAC.2
MCEASSRQCCVTESHEGPESAPGLLGFTRGSSRVRSAMGQCICTIFASLSRSFFVEIPTVRRCWTLSGGWQVSGVNAVMIGRLSEF